MSCQHDTATQARVRATLCCLRRKSECCEKKGMTAVILHSDLVRMAATAADREIGGRAAANCFGFGTGPAAQRRTQADPACALAGRDGSVSPGTVAGTAPGGSIQSAAALPSREQNPVPDPAPAPRPPIGAAAVRACGSTPLGGPGSARGRASGLRASTSGRCCESMRLMSSIGGSAAPGHPFMSAGAARASADEHAPAPAASSPGSSAAAQASLQASSLFPERWPASGPPAAAASGPGPGCGCRTVPAPGQRGRKNCASRSPATCSALRPAASRSSSARPASSVRPSAHFRVDVHRVKCACSQQSNKEEAASASASKQKVYRLCIAYRTHSQTSLGTLRHVLDNGLPKKLLSACVMQTQT